MMKTIQILGSSSSSSGCFSLPHRLKKPHSNFNLISRNPILAAVLKSPKSHFCAFQIRKGRFFRAFQMSQTHSESTPDGGPSPPSSSTSTAVHSAVSFHFSNSLTLNCFFYLLWIVFLLFGGF